MNFSYWLFRSVLKLKHRPHYDRFLQSTTNPLAVQERVLRGILDTNKDTEFGRQHGFSATRSIKAFQERVPIRDFEELRPYIARPRDQGVQVLTRNAPVYYNRTSGTTGTPKDIPVTQDGLDQIKRDSQIGAYILTRQSDFLEGKIFAVGGAAIEDRTPIGVPIGSASGLLYRQQSRFVRSRYVIPPEVFDIQDIETRYVVLAILGMNDEHVTAIATANPSTFVRLNDVINANVDTILKHLSEGTLPDAGMQLPAIQANAKRAQLLSRAFEKDTPLSFRVIWPSLRGVVTWCGGSCGFALAKLRKLIPQDCKIVEFGYNSSEYRGTINVNLSNNLCLPTLHNTFFEFVEQDDWENDHARFLGLHEIETDQSYYVLVTTTNGLYRYNINDIVRATQHLNSTPSLEFVQKGKGVTNITGEKLTEFQILQAIYKMRSKHGFEPDFFVVLADEINAQYLLCCEFDGSANADEIASSFDHSLQRLNIEYQSKRKSQRLLPIRFVRLPAGSGFAYRSERIAAGQRDAQFKYLHLQYAKDSALHIPS